MANNNNALRRAFYRELLAQVKLVWPIVSALLLLIALGGVIVARLEGWTLGDGVYFAFITSLTVGYGDLTPVRTSARILAVGLGIVGILLAALLAAIAVRSLTAVMTPSATNDSPDRGNPER